MERPPALVMQCITWFTPQLWAPSGTNHKAKLAISPSGWLDRCTNVKYLHYKVYTCGAKVYNPRSLNRKLLSDVLAKNSNDYATNSYAFIFSQLP